MVKKPKPEKRERSVEGYFRAIQEDLAALRAEMSTKDETRKIRGDMEHGFKNVYHQIGEVRGDVGRLNEIMVLRWCSGSSRNAVRLSSE